MKKRKFLIEIHFVHCLRLPDAIMHVKNNSGNRVGTNLLRPSAMNCAACRRDPRRNELRSDAINWSLHYSDIFPFANLDDSSMFGRHNKTKVSNTLLITMLTV